MGVPRVEDIIEGADFCSVVAASPGDTTHTVLMVLVATIRIALDNGNGVDESTVEPIRRLSKLEARQVEAMKSN